METYKGIAASRGIGIGEVYVLSTGITKVPAEKVEDIARELEKLDAAMASAKATLTDLYEKTCREVGEAEAQIFDIHRMMLDDLDYQENIHRLIEEESFCAEYAVFHTGEEFAEMFLAMDDEYMNARSADVKDISERVVRCMMDPEGTESAAQELPHVVAAEDLLPSVTIQMDKSKVLGFVTKVGSWTSHAAILARTLNIPAVLSLNEGFDALKSGDSIIVDGFKGQVIVNPDEATVAKYRVQQSDYRARMERLAQLKDVEAKTKDGVRIEVVANIGGKNDAVTALENGAEGVGLFRSEFLFMQGEDYPTEETQAEAYRYVLAKMGNRRVVVRTFDIGADKTAPYMEFPHEDNPAMGCRATRYSLRHRELLKTQLRALLRASVYGRLGIMFPMIATVDEARKAKAVLAECKRELDAEGVPYSDSIEVGIMIEIPSAALISDQLAKEVDFFSIGTNDLTQFTMAVDRMNGELIELYDTRHPAVLRLMAMTAKNARENGIWCGICGESGADLALTETWARMGISELSVTPGSLLEVKEKVLSLDLRKPFKPFIEYR